MKKVLGIILALICVLSFSVCAFACSVETVKEDETQVVSGEFSVEDVTKAPVSGELPEKKSEKTLVTNEILVVSGEFAIEDVVKAPYFGDMVAPKSGSYFSFAGCTKNEIYSDMADRYYSDGDTVVLTINQCSWIPQSNDLEIGLFNTTYAITYKPDQPFSDGELNGVSVTFSNLKAGNYWVYVRNLGSPTITSGYLSYSTSK